MELFSVHYPYALYHVADASTHSMVELIARHVTEARLHGAEILGAPLNQVTVTRQGEF